jgi:Fic family protein
VGGVDKMSILDQVDWYKRAIGGLQPIDELRPFEGHLLQQIKDYYRIGLTWSSNAIEGNTLTISETKVLLEDGLTVGGKPLRDTFETLGHAEAYDFMYSLLGNRIITLDDILTMHRLFYAKIDAKQAGVYRGRDVFITGSNYPVCAAQHLEGEMERLFAWVASQRNDYHPVDFAAILHKKFVFIHPFIDGNGRLARLLMNTTLIQDGYLLAIIPPVLRLEYVTLLEQAHENDLPFREFIARSVLESEKEIMRLRHIPFPDKVN